MVVFLSNPSETKDITVIFQNREFKLPRWSVSIYEITEHGFNLRYSTASPAPSLESSQTKESHAVKLALQRQKPWTSDLVVEAPQDFISYMHEPVGIWDPESAIYSSFPLEQIGTTKDESDYLWYVQTNITIPHLVEAATKGKDKGKGKGKDRDEEAGEGSPLKLILDAVEDVADVWLDGVPIGNVEGVQIKHAGNKFEELPSIGSIGPVEVDIPADFLAGLDVAKQHTLSILTSVAGVENCCARLERIRKGIIGSVFLNKNNITAGRWYHQVGLRGEKEEVSKIHYLSYTLFMALS
jgi:hypothetical protein